MTINSEKVALLGLDPMHAEVYLAALELGEASIQELSRKSGVNRSTIYTFIEQLKERSILHETRKGRRKLYTALDPEQFIKEEQKRVAELREMLPELQAIDNSSKRKPRVTYFEGMGGIEEVYRDMLKDKNTIFAYEDLDHLKEGLPSSIFDWFPKERVRRDIEIKSISRDTEFAREFSKKNIGLLRDNKFISVPDLRTDINIYGTKVALMDLRGTPPSCVLIENKHLADTLRVFWEELWQRIEK